jgi:hypothetical protein
VAQGQPGADSSEAVTTSLIQLATNRYGATPAFWGRYFTSVNTATSEEYRRAEENQPLNVAGIRLLPIARQIRNVSGSLQQGIEDGAANAEDFIATSGAPFLASQRERFYMFLDVEGDPSEGSPSLSSDYFTGWAQGLAQESAAASSDLSNGSVERLPCVYARQADLATWTVLDASQASAQCMGVWIARYYSGDCAMSDWNDSVVTPASPASPAPFPWPILVWHMPGSA